MRLRTCALVLSITACVLLGSLGTGVASAKIDPNAAARTCAAGRAIGSRLNGHDIPYVRRFVLCVIRNFRQQLGQTFRSSAAISRDAEHALESFARAPAESPKRDGEAVNSAGLKIFRQFCAVKGRYGFLSGDSTPPPVLTVATLSSLIKKILFEGGHSVARQGYAVFGFAYRRGVVFHDKSGGDYFSLAVYALGCPTAPPAQPSGQVTFTDIGVSDSYRPGAHAWRFRTRLVRDGKSFGMASGRCTHRSGANSNDCSETLRLANGSISVHVPRFALSKPSGGTGTIVRGTGAFRHARGAISEREITKSVTRDTLSFR